MTLPSPGARSLPDARTQQQRTDPGERRRRRGWPRRDADRSSSAAGESAMV